MTLDTSFNSLISRLISNPPLGYSAYDSSKPLHIASIPMEVLHHIFSYLTPKEQLEAAAVCRLWAIEIFDNPKNNLALENAKALPGMTTDGSLPDFFNEARFYYHMNVRMAQVFARNLQNFDIDPSPFPNLLFTPVTLPKAIELDDLRSITKKKNDLALIRFYNLLLEPLLGPFPVIEPEDPQIMAKKIRAFLTTTGLQTVKQLTSLDIKPEGSDLDFHLPQEICLFSSLETLKISGERIGDGELQNGHEFIPSATIHFPNKLGSLLSLKNLELAFFKTIGHMPNIPSLTYLYFRGCRNLVNLPKEIENQTGLHKLVILGCHALQTLPENIGNLTELDCFKISLCNSLASLPTSLVRLTNLTKFEIFGCAKLLNQKDNKDMKELYAKIKALPNMKNFQIS